MSIHLIMVFLNNTLSIMYINVYIHKKDHWREQENDNVDLNF